MISGCLCWFSKSKQQPFNNSLKFGEQVFIFIIFLSGKTSNCDIKTTEKTNFRREAEAGLTKPQDHVVGIYTFITFDTKGKERIYA